MCWLVNRYWYSHSCILPLLFTPTNLHMYRVPKNISRNSHLAWIYLHIGTLIKIKRKNLNFKTYPHLHTVLPLYQCYRNCDCFQILNGDRTFGAMDPLLEKETELQHLNQSQ